ncbi:MAG: Si-specific NAD(P)(+) transhydrogenase [Gammaproteobacteria bacterium]|nr:MAG: Si-specific NAD(P)(+) transhydrogenase [Gammaproteobacteria bacterium]
MSQYDVDVLVIGAGPAGEGAALNAAKHGLNAAIIHNRPQVGGACTHLGTIPSKSLRNSVQNLMKFNNNPSFKEVVDPIAVSFPKLLANAQDVIRKQVKMRAKFYQRNRIDLYHGTASFVDAHTVSVLQEDGARIPISAGSIIIATGSSPFRPDDIDFQHPRIYDSDTLLHMQHTPRKVLIYGAGVIGCEYASIFSGIGTKVDLINTRDQLLEFLDDEISDALSYHLRDHGVMIRHNEHYTRVEADDHGVALHLESGKVLHGDCLLWCNGRTGNSASLNLSAIGVSANSRGYVEVDGHYRTTCPSVYAAGDIIGWPSLASAAYNQGRAASASARGKAHCHHVDDVPTGIYTIPEISSVGMTERTLTEKKIPYEVGRAFFKETARGQISGDEVGMLKILFHPQTMEILGIHCFGAEATEIIHIGQAIMKQGNGGNTIRYFLDNTFNYPTMAEAYRIAALNGINRLDLPSEG